MLISGEPNVRFGLTVRFGSVRFGTYQTRVRFGRTLTLKFGQTELNRTFDFLPKSVQKVLHIFQKCLLFVRKFTFLEIHACL